MIKSITALGIEEDGNKVFHKADTEQEALVGLFTKFPHIGNGDFEDVTVYFEHDLTNLMDELELKYVPVEACNGLAMVMNPISPDMEQQFGRMDCICSHAPVRTKIDMLEELSPVALYFTLKSGGIKQTTVWNKAYKLMGNEFRVLVNEDD